MTQAIAQSVAAGESTWRRRAVGAIVFLGAATLTAIAAALHPAAAGHGTHEQLGLPPCSTYMFTGRPCPTCGYTTAFSHLAHGRLIEAFIVQPAGALAALVIVAAGFVGGYVMVSGRDLGDRLRPVLRWQTLLIVAGVVLAGWAYKLAVMP